MIDLTKLIEQANELAPLPASTVRLAGLIGNPDCRSGRGDGIDCVRPGAHPEIIARGQFRRHRQPGSRE